MAEKAGLHTKTQELKEKCSSFCKRKSKCTSLGSPSDRVLQLQRTAGNQAVQRLIKSKALQAKLRIGQPNDMYEQEADRVAEQVMKMPDPASDSQSRVNSRSEGSSIQSATRYPEKDIQRKEATDEEEEIVQMKQGSLSSVAGSHPAVPPSVHGVLSSPGFPLDQATRKYMEPRFGHDFSGVRVHTDEKAAESAREVNAQVYTVGRDIVFGAGQYSPSTSEGKRLMAHELTHVSQQWHPLSFARASLEQGLPGSVEERQANEVTEVGLEGHKMPTVSLSPALCLQRKDPEQKQKEGGKASKGENICEAGKKKCVPAAVTYDEIMKIPGVKPGTLGHTKANTIDFGLESQFKNGTCSVKLTHEPELTFKHFVYVKPGTYFIGKTTLQEGKCTGNQVEQYLTITTKMAERIKQGEIEHCVDLNQAFDLSYGRYLSAGKKLVTGFPAKDSKTCSSEISKRLVQDTGIEIAKWKTVADCLLEKTLERDKSWHVVDPGKQSISKDCKKVTYTPDPSATLTEVCKHPSSEVIKGCGEK